MAGMLHMGEHDWRYAELLNLISSNRILRALGISRGIQHSMSEKAQLNILRNQAEVLSDLPAIHNPPKCRMFASSSIPFLFILSDNL